MFIQSSINADVLKIMTYFVSPLESCVRAPLSVEQSRWIMEEVVKTFPTLPIVHRLSQKSHITWKIMTFISEAETFKMQRYHLKHQVEV